jgi:hypothetical protein
MPDPALILRRANVSRISGQWQDEDYYVFDGDRDAEANCFASAVTICLDVPSAIRRFDETECGGNLGMVKDFVVAVGINSVQAARHHRPMTFRQSRGSSAEDDGCSQSNLGLGEHFPRSIL